MPEHPIGELDAPFSSQGAEPTPWADVEEALDAAEIFWITTVRPDGRPHVTPLVGIWLDGAMHFTTGSGERKERNLRGNAHCVLTTGSNAFREGLDVVLEGEAERVVDAAALGRVAERIAAKYDWRWAVAGDALTEVAGPDPGAEENGARALVFRVAPSKVFAYRRGEVFSATRWRS
jgi:nitroimidazol reductase NimA-like FMN-containing flavoprotein (pyridoxamine 5'-phosphate oxidase superfamily)